MGDSSRGIIVKGMSGIYKLKIIKFQTGNNINYS